MSEADLFVFDGDTVLPNGNSIGKGVHKATPMEDFENFGQDLSKATGKAKRKVANHHERTRNWATRQGWLYSPCEMKDIYFDGKMSREGKKHDLFGIADAICVDSVHRQVILLQIVSTSINKAKGSSRNDHLRKMCSEAIETKTKRSYLANLRSCLNAGIRVVILDWEQREKVGSQEWFPVVSEVTHEVINRVLERRRKSA